MHDPDFRQAEKDWKSFVECLTEKLMEVDDEIPELPVKDIVSYDALTQDNGETLTNDGRCSASTETSASRLILHPTR